MGQPYFLELRLSRDLPSQAPSETTIALNLHWEVKAYYIPEFHSLGSELGFGLCQL